MYSVSTMFKADLGKYCRFKYLLAAALVMAGLLRVICVSRPARIIQFFNRKPLRPSREIYRQFKSRSPNLGSNEMMHITDIYWDEAFAGDTVLT